MDRPMTEIVFVVEEAPEGGWTARALGESIFTEADDRTTLRKSIVDAVHCHFPDAKNCPLTTKKLIGVKVKLR